MRVLFAHNDYGRPSGEEAAIESIANILQAHGHEVVWHRRTSSDIRSVSAKVGAFFSGIYSLKAKAQISRTLKTQRFDLVHAQNLYPFLSPSILGACQKAGVPVVMRCPNYRIFCPNGLHLSHGEICERCLGGREYWCVVRNCERDHFKSLGYALRNGVARLTRTILDNVDVFIVLSDFQKQRFVDGGIEPDRLEVLPNFVPDVEYDEEVDGLGDLITFVGRASPEKGVEDFVAAAKALPDLPFAVAGTTERMPDLLKNSPSNLRWLGFLKERELNKVYANSRFLVFPFRWFEGFPNVITRAMVMEKPVVASRIGAIPEIVTDGKTGLLFGMGDVDDLVRKITELYPDKERCRALGVAARAKATLQYSPQAVYSRLIEIYQKAVNTRLSKCNTGRRFNHSQPQTLSCRDAV